MEVGEGFRRDAIGSIVQGRGWWVLCCVVVNDWAAVTSTGGKDE